MTPQESTPAPQTHQEALFEMPVYPVAPKVRPDILPRAAESPSDIDGVQLEMSETNYDSISEATGIDLSDNARRAQMRGEREDSGWGDRKNDTRDYGSRRTGPAVVVSIVNVEDIPLDPPVKRDTEPVVGMPQALQVQIDELKERRAALGDTHRVSPHLPLGTEADRTAAQNAKDKQALSISRNHHPANPRKNK